jgi:alpha-tubulin suppressor-like RCC1 family protein
MTNKLCYSIFLITLLMVGLTPMNWANLPQQASVFAQSSNLLPLQNIVQVTAGRDHTCVLTTDGRVKCWGGNHRGQLGDGTTSHRDTPVVVSGLNSHVASIAAGRDHTCALTIDGGVKCWGSNGHGELGDGKALSERSVPADVVGLSSGVAEITTGNQHTCVVTTVGAVKCWGDNHSGQLGDGAMLTERSSPVDVLELSASVIAIAAGRDHTCAVTQEGAVKCWGSNRYGQLGDGTTENKSTPVDVVGLNSGVMAIAAGVIPVQ